MKVYFTSLLLALLAAAPVALGGSSKVRSSLSFDKEEMNPGNVGSGSDFVPHDGKNESAEHPVDPRIVVSNFIPQDLL